MRLSRGKVRRSVRIPKIVAGMEHTVFLAMLKEAKIAAPVAEHGFAKDEGRRFRFDYSWPDVKVAIEVEGGIWSRGSHGRGTGIVRDMEKGNLAAVKGWTVLRLTPQQLPTIGTIDLLQRAFHLKESHA